MSIRCGLPSTLSNPACSTSMSIRCGLPSTLIQYFPLNVDGSPHLMDMEVEQAGLLTWGKVWPALSNSAHEGAHRRPLAPGEMRTFEGMMPQSFDGEDWVPPDPPRKFAARVTNLRFCP